MSGIINVSPLKTTCSFDTVVGLAGCRDADLREGEIAYVQTVGSLAHCYYRLHRRSTATPDNVNVVIAHSGTGRWILFGLGSLGASGPTGFTGFTGATGFTGYVGPAGPATAGPAGVAGFTGPAGAISVLTGTTGPQGYDGYPGVTGPMGPGSTGPAGYDGLRGPTGFAGSSCTQILNLASNDALIRAGAWTSVVAVAMPTPPATQAAPFKIQTFVDIDLGLAGASFQAFSMRLRASVPGGFELSEIVSSTALVEFIDGAEENHVRIYMGHLFSSATAGGTLSVLVSPASNNYAWNRGRIILSARANYL